MAQCSGLSFIPVQQSCAHTRCKFPRLGRVVAASGAEASSGGRGSRLLPASGEPDELQLERVACRLVFDDGCGSPSQELRGLSRDRQLDHHGLCESPGRSIKIPLRSGSPVVSSHQPVSASPSRQSIARGSRTGEPICSADGGRTRRISSSIRSTSVSPSSGGVDTQSISARLASADKSVALSCGGPTPRQQQSMPFSSPSSERTHGASRRKPSSLVFSVS